eukprot:3187120-Pyramimonas_sp.AAC.1
MAHDSGCDAVRGEGRGCEGRAASAASSRRKARRMPNVGASRPAQLCLLAGLDAAPGVDLLA